ncbi:MAG TPA: hypothetical protein VGH33_28010 [Isosphaeraceae bacterium]
MSVRLPKPLRSTMVLAAIALAGPTAHAQDARMRLESATLPRPMINGEAPDTVIEASGVEPIGDGRRALVAHDKAPALHVVDLASGWLVGGPLASPKFPPQSKTGPKWEGMARDSEGNYYLIGSHSGKTDAERAEKAVLIRFRLKGADSDSPAIDDDSVVRWHVARPLASALKGLGLDEAKVAKRKVEGLAVREREGRRELVIGLREPDDKVRAFVADITSAPSPDAELELKPLFAFDAGLREGVQAQLTSLEYVPALRGLLVVTATEDEGNIFHGNTLWFVADGAADRAAEVATFEVAMKAEGLAVLDARDEGRRKVVKLLITFDNDPEATKIPSRFQTATLVAEPR